MHGLVLWTRGLDYSKAFKFSPAFKTEQTASVWLKGDILKWIKNFLIGRQQKTILNGSSSQWIDVKSGVPQGSVLGPLLFTYIVC